MLKILSSTSSKIAGGLVLAAGSLWGGKVYIDSATDPVVARVQNLETQVKTLGEENGSLKILNKNLAQAGEKAKDEIDWLKSNAITLDFDTRIAEMYEKATGTISGRMMIGSGGNIGLIDKNGRPKILFITNYHNIQVEKTLKIIDTDGKEEVIAGSISDALHDGTFLIWPHKSNRFQLPVCKAKVVFASKQDDLALLEYIDLKESPSFVLLHDESEGKIKTGARCYLTGAGLTMKDTFSHGRISNPSIKVPLHPDVISDQTSAPIHPGHSGSLVIIPIITKEGTLDVRSIGIAYGGNTQISSASWLISAENTLAFLEKAKYKPMTQAQRKELYDADLRAIIK